MSAVHREKRICAQLLHRRIQEIVRMAPRVGIRDDTLRPRRLVISKNANQPSQLQRDTKLLAKVERIIPELLPDGGDIPSDDHEGDDRVPPQEMPENVDHPSQEKEKAERSPPKSQILCSEVYLVQETGECLIFDKRNYNVSILVCITANKIHPVNHVFDTSVGLNPI